MKRKRQHRHIPCAQVVESGSEQSHFEDEVLERIWELRETGEELFFDDIHEEFPNDERLTTMEKNALFYKENSKIILTEDGECHARDIIRRHRLAERLFADVLDIKDFEADALPCWGTRRAAPMESPSQRGTAVSSIPGR
jgi:hypothetical protein